MLDAICSTGGASADLASKIADVWAARADFARDHHDIIKGLALGATIVAIGRPYMWGLAQGGAEGARAITRLLRAELLVDMALAGQTAVRGITRDAVASVNY